MVYDDKRHVAVLFLSLPTGGTELWDWNGVSWRKHSPADPLGDGRPGQRQSPAFAYAAARGSSVLFGGRGGGSASGDTWLWDGAANESVAQVVSFAFSAAECASEVGATLFGWDGGAFVAMASTSASGADPQQILWTSADPAWLARLRFGRQATLNFAVRPKAGNGCALGYGSVASDAVELSVGYSLP